MPSRRPKGSALETILYEIDMFRICAPLINESKGRFEREHTDDNEAQYYLAIEGFLLHLRNLLAFFASRRDRDSDLILNDPQQWAAQPMDHKLYSDLAKNTREFDQRAIPNFSVHAAISKYLQHCTTLRHEQPTEWDTDSLYQGFNPILTEFEKRFCQKAVKRTSSEESNGTASFRVID